MCVDTYIYIYVYVVELKAGPDFALFVLNTGPDFFLCAFFFDLFLKISFSLQKEEEFSKKKQKK